MIKKHFHRLPNSLRMGLWVTLLVGLLIGLSAWIQVQREQRTDLDEMDRRASVIAHQTVYAVQTALRLPDKEAVVALGSTLEGYRRLMGLAVYRADGQRVATGKAVSEFADTLQKVVDQTLQSSKDTIMAERAADTPIHVLASLIRTPEGQPEGVLVVVQDLLHLEQRATTRLYLMGF